MLSAQKGIDSMIALYSLRPKEAKNKLKDLLIIAKGVYSVYNQYVWSFIYVLVMTYIGIMFWLLKANRFLRDQRDSLKNKLNLLEEELKTEIETNSDLTDHLVKNLHSFYEQNELILCNDGKYRAKCTIEK